jgi:hypothetical protein
VSNQSIKGYIRYSIVYGIVILLYSRVAPSASYAARPGGDPGGGGGATETPPPASARTPDGNRVPLLILTVYTYIRRISQFGTEKCQFGTEKCQFGTEKCQFGTETCQFGTEKCQFGTEKCQFGTETCQFGTEICQFGTEKCQFGTEKCQFTCAAGADVPDIPHVLLGEPRQEIWHQQLHFHHRWLDGRQHQKRGLRPLRALLLRPGTTDISQSPTDISQSPTDISQPGQATGHTYVGDSPEPGESCTHAATPCTVWAFQ